MGTLKNPPPKLALRQAMAADSREAVGTTLNLLHSESAAPRSGRLFAGAPRAHSDSESGLGIFRPPDPAPTLTLSVSEWEITL